MRTDYTHITVILDRSGSMESIKDDTIGGFNDFLREQQEQPHYATMTLVQFDTKNPYEVISDFVPLSEVLKLNKTNYTPRSGTPLLDALGRGIADLDTKIAKMPETERPEQIVFLVITDGLENSSREFQRKDIKDMIKQRQEQQGWQFVFLSADLSAIEEAEGSGFRYDSSMSFDKSGKGVRSAFSSSSKGMKAYREKLSERMAFTDDDRAAQDSEKSRKKPQKSPKDVSKPENDLDGKV